MKTIIVACGAGVATSTIMVDRVKKLLDKHQIEATIIQCTLGDIERYVGRAQLIVTSMNLEKVYSIPVVMGISFITGVGQTETENKIIKILN